MTVSDEIRKLASEGVETAEIARRLNIRYQHAYGVLKRSDLQKSVPARSAKISSAPLTKPQLRVRQLLDAGFQLSGRWIVSPEGVLLCDRSLPKSEGVYAFVQNDIALYVGIATMGIAKRLYFYGKPGVTQRTSQRVHREILEALRSVPHIEIYTATPSGFDWNGLPVHGSAGLELGLIKKFSLLWNIRNAGL